MGPTPEHPVPPPTSSNLPAWMLQPPPPPPRHDKDVTVAEVVATRPLAAAAPTTSPSPDGKGKKGTALAPGFRFHPTDEELVSYYLKRKVTSKPVRFAAIAEVDIYKNEPWDLAEKSRLKSRDQEWYFFSALDKKYTNGARMNRATGKGYWKATGKDREVRRDSQIIAMKKTLVFHSGRAPGGQRTNWVMHEYRLHEEEYERIKSAQLEPFVLCRVFHKNNIGPPNGNRYAPFLEEEWDDGQTALVPGVDAADEVVAAHETSGETIQVDQDSRSINKDLAGENDLRSSQNALPVCKAEKVDDFPPLCVLNTEAPFPLLQYKRRRTNNDTGSNGSNSSENSAWTNQDLSSSSTTTVTTDLMMTTNSATTTAVSALMEFHLMDPVEGKERTRAPTTDATRLYSSIPPSCMKFITDLQEEMQKISVERDTLRLDLMSARAMIDILQSRADHLREENEDLKRRIRHSE